MTKIEQKEKFISFLKKNRIYKKYFAALKAYIMSEETTFNKAKDIDNFFEIIYIDLWIIDAFSWADSGGFVFWNPIDDAWRKIINNK